MSSPYEDFLLFEPSKEVKRSILKGLMKDLLDFEYEEPTATSDTILNRLMIDSEIGSQSYTENMPEIYMPRNSTITVLPPFGTAVVRFIITSNGMKVSVLLSDEHSIIVPGDEKVWEVMGLGGGCDPDRVSFDPESSEGLVQIIEKQFRLMGHNVVFPRQEDTMFVEIAKGINSMIDDL